MSTRKIKIPAFLELRNANGELGVASFAAVQASADLQKRLTAQGRRRFQIGIARLRGEFRTAEDLNRGTIVRSEIVAAPPSGDPPNNIITVQFRR